MFFSAIFLGAFWGLFGGFWGLLGAYFLALFWGLLGASVAQFLGAFWGPLVFSAGVSFLARVKKPCKNQ